MIGTAAGGRAASLCVVVGLVLGAGCATARGYPRAVIDRPLVLPSGLARAGLDVSATDDGRSLSTNATAAAGLAGDVEIEAGHQLGDHSLGLGLGVLAFQHGPLAAALRAGERYDLTRASWQPVSLGVEAWLTLGRALIGLRGDLAVPVTGEGGATAVLPLSVGVQLTPIVYAEVDAELALARGGCDALPTSFELVTSAMPRLDVLLAMSGRLALAHGLERGEAGALIGMRYYAGW